VPLATTVDGQRIPIENRPVKAQARKAAARRIRIRLIERGWSVTELARRARLTRNYTSLVVHGHRGSEAARRRIARALGMGIDEAFPQGKVEVEVKSGGMSRKGEIPRRTSE